jgi:hypothetical protein
MSGVEENYKLHSSGHTSNDDEIQATGDELYMSLMNEIRYTY